VLFPTICLAEFVKIELGQLRIQIRGIMHLTYHPNDGHIHAATTANTAEGAGAPGDEIKVTRKMIAAGVQALPFIDSSAIGSMTEETLVSRVYRAMEAEFRRGRSPSRPVQT
jgi:hypothetical protein